MGCVGSIQKVLGAVAGVSSVAGDAETKVVTVEYDDSRVSPAELLGHLDAAGFPSTLTQGA